MLVGHHHTYHAVIIISSRINFLNRFDSHRCIMAFALYRIGNSVLFRQNIHTVISARPCHFHTVEIVLNQYIRTEVFKFVPFHLVHTSSFSGKPELSCKQKNGNDKQQHDHCRRHANPYRCLIFHRCLSRTVDSTFPFLFYLSVCFLSIVSV